MLSNEMMPRCRRTSDLGLFLRRAAIWFAAKQRRGAWRQRVVLLHDIHAAARIGDAAFDLSEDVARRQFLGRVRAYVRRLSAANQQLYAICVVQGCDSTEAASRLGCTPAAARKRLERLRGRLRRVAMAEREQPPELQSCATTRGAGATAGAPAGFRVVQPARLERSEPGR